MFVFTLPVANDGTTKDEVVQVLRSLESVLSVDVLERRMRTKRDEF